MNTNLSKRRAVIFMRAHEPIALGLHDRMVERGTIEAQRVDCRNAAKQLDAVVVQEYDEHGGAKRLDNRPKLRHMLDELRALRDIDYVIVTSLDRLTRSAQDFAQIQFELELIGAELVIASQAHARKEVSV